MDSNSSRSNVSTTSLGIATHKSSTKVVTIADSPEVHPMEVDEEPLVESRPVPYPVHTATPPPFPEPATLSTPPSRNHRGIPAVNVH